MQQNERKKRIYPEITVELLKRNETYEDFGKAIGMTRSAVARRMTGAVKWQIDEIYSVCKHFGKDFYELFDSKQ